MKEERETSIVEWDSRAVLFFLFFFFEIGKKKKYGRKAREYRHGGDEGEKKEGERKGEM